MAGSLGCGVKPCCSRADHGAVAEDARANLLELEYLQKTIGPTGRLAIAPFIKTSSRDLWQIYMLSREKK